MSSRASRPRSKMASRKSTRSRRQRLAAGAVLATTSLLGTYLAAIRPQPTYAAPNTTASETTGVSARSVAKAASFSSFSTPTCASADVTVTDDTGLRAAILQSNDDSVICIDGTIDLLGPLPTIDDTSLTLVGTDEANDRLNAYFDEASGYHTRILDVDFSSTDDDTLTISYLTLALADDTVDARGGAALYFGGDSAEDTLLVYSSDFYLNTSDGKGGAVRVTDGAAYFYRVSFDMNESRFDYGGAIYLDSGEIALIESGLYDNYAANGGGAIGLGDVTFAGGAFVSIAGNASSSGGGAIHVKGGSEAGEVLFTNSFIGDNYSYFDAGAIQVVDGDLNLWFTTMYDDSSIYGPSAIYLDDTATLSSIGSVVGSSVDGAVLSVAAGATIDDTFSITTGSGTDPFSGQGSQQVAAGSLQLQVADGPYIGEAGMAPAPTSVLVTGAPNSNLGTGIIVDQLGARRGPAIWTIGARQVTPPMPVGCDALATDDTLLRASITNSLDGDVICIDGMITLESPLPTIDDTTLTLLGDDSSVDIIDGNNDRILAADFSDTGQDDTLTISNLTFAYADSTGAGSAIALGGDASSSGNLIISGSTFLDNEATDEGGAIAVTDADLTVSNSQFVLNYAISVGNSAGGAVYVRRGDARFVDSFFQSNYALGPGESSFGGAVYAQGGDVEVQDSRFVGNSANGSGGALAVFDGALAVEGSAIGLNFALAANGGGVFARDAEVTISTSYLLLNTANYYGGAVFMDDSNGPANTLSVTDSEMQLNEAFSGGAVMLTNGTSMDATRSSFLQNEVSAQGGAVYVDGATASFVNSYLGSNISNTAGASIAAVDGDVSLEFSTIYDDSVATAGEARSIFAAVNTSLSVVGSVVGSPTDDSVIEIASGSTLDDTYSISTGQGTGFTGTGSSQVAGGSLDLAPFNRVGPRTAGRSPYEGSILLTDAPSSDLGTGVTVDQLGVTRGPKWTIGARQAAVQPPTPPTPPAPIPPSAPQQVSASAGDGQATITWTAPASAGTFPVTQYQVMLAPGGETCLVASSSTQCTITGLTNGTTYTAQVRALSGAGWGPYSAESDPFTPEAPPVAQTIVIIGTRGEVRGKPGIIVSGKTTGFEAGDILRPWVKFPGQTSYSEGVARIEVQAGEEFTWQRRTGKKIYVFIRSEDGEIKSNRLIIRR